MPGKTAIIICTKNRAASLERLLMSLREQSLLPDQIEVIDNGSTDGTPEVTAAFPRVVYHFCPKQGLAECRQIGLDASEAEVAVMCDDDCVPTPPWLQTIVQTFETNPEVAVVAGRIVNHGFPNGLKGRGKLGPNGLYQLVDDPRDAEFFGSANMALRTSAIRQIGGYDTRFTRGYEEVDLVKRVRQAGFAVLYSPEASLDHHHVPSAGRPRFMHRSRQGMRLYFFFKHYWPASLKEWTRFFWIETSLVLHELKCEVRSLCSRSTSFANVRAQVARTAALVLDRVLLPHWIALAWCARKQTKPPVEHARVVPRAGAIKPAALCE